MNKTEFLEKVEKFLKKRKLHASDFGKMAINDTKLIFTLRNGRECREATQRRVLEFMKNYKKQEKR